MACVSPCPEVSHEVGNALAAEQLQEAPARRSDTPSTVSDVVMAEETTAVKVPMSFSPASRTVDDAVAAADLRPALPAEPKGPEATKTRSSKYRGVCWNKKNKRWQAAINNGGRYIYLGSFISDEAAARAFDLAALQIRGEHTKLNFSVENYPEAEWKGGAPAHLAEKYMSGVRPKTTPFRQFTGAPMKKINPSQFAAIHVPVKRNRFEDTTGFGKRGFDRAEQRFLSSAYFTTPGMTGQTKIKQEFPTVPFAVETPSRKLEGLGSPFEASPFFFRQSGITSNNPQTNPSFQTPSITTPNFGHRLTEADVGRKELVFRSIVADRMEDDSAEQMKGMTPCGVPLPLKSPATLTLDSSAMSDRLPVPLLQAAQEEPSLHVSSVISETVSGSEIEEAKVILGSSRNQFGLIHRLVNQSKWNALVWDGNTMHSMGVYAAEDDSQVACSSAVRLVEALMVRRP